MGTTSKHYGDMIIFVENTIKSCTTYEHTITTNRLIRLLYNKLPLDLKFDECGRLRDMLDSKRKRISRDEEGG